MNNNENADLMVNNENEDYMTELTIGVDTDGREVIEMSMLTAMISLARCSEKGKQLIESATDEIIMDMLNTYSRVKIIY